MNDGFDSFRCGNCRQHRSTSERAKFSKAFKIASLIIVIFWFAPSVAVWPRDVCRSCAGQVVAVTSFFIAVALAIAAAWADHLL